MLHHIGYACTDIKEALESIKLKYYNITNIIGPLYDTLQDAFVCLVEIENHPAIELVSGNAVTEFIKAEINLYHICYEVHDLHNSIMLYKDTGGVLVSEPKPAKLFSDRLVAFLQTDFGLVELLQKEHKRDGLENANYVNVVLSSNYVANEITKKLNYLSSLYQLNYCFYTAPYNQVVQELLSDQSLTGLNNEGINLILIKLQDNWFKKATPSDSFIIDEQSYYNDFIRALKVASDKSPNSKFLVLVCPPENINDHYYLEKLKLVKEVIETEFYLKNNVKWLSWAYLSSNYDPERHFCNEANKIANMPYAEKFETTIALELLRALYLEENAFFKVVVIDCDNTLWDGVCGEQEVEELGISYARELFHKKILEFYEQGILLCLCSKNNEDDVWQVFHEKSNFKLDVNHFASYRINWKDKATNIKDLAEELNLSLDSFIFIDDNPVECDLISRKFPSVLVLPFPEEDNDIKYFTNNIWPIALQGITAEDKKRTDFYKANVHRDKLKENSLTLKSYIRYLNVQVELDNVRVNELERVSQLTKRTNQFNCFTTQRSPQELNNLLEKGKEVLIVKASDRYGDYGLIGVVICHFINKTIEVETFLISCRALGKGVEHQVIEKLASRYDKSKYYYLSILFVETEKNIPAKDFLECLPTVSVTRDDNNIYKYTIDLPLSQPIDFDSTKRKEQNKDPATKPRQASQKNPFNRLLYDVALGILMPNSNLWGDDIKKPLGLSVNSQGYLKDQVLAIWQEIIGSNNIGFDTNFYTLGGTSFMAARIAAKINNVLSVNCEIIDILEYNTVNLLTDKILSKKVSGHVTNLEDKFSVDEDLIPASYNQKQLYFMYLFDGTSPTYNMPLAIKLRGELNKQALEEAFYYLINRHEALRTKFEHDNGNVYQKIRENFDFSIEEVDVTSYQTPEIDELIEQYENQPFKLETNLLIRAILFQLASDNHILLVLKHHIISDGWSDSIFLKELSDVYNALLNGQKVYLSKLTHNYQDFTKWQLEKIISGKLQPQLNYWTEKLNNYKKLKLPEKHKSGEKIGGYICFDISQEMSNKVKTLAQKQQTTVYNLFLCIFNILLRLKTHQNDILLGSVFSCRDNLEFQNVIGFFANVLPIRTDLSTSKTFIDLIEVSHKNILQAQANKEVPFERIVNVIVSSNERASADNPLFDIFFAYQDLYTEAPTFQNLESSFYKDGYNLSRFDLTLEVQAKNNNFKIIFYYDKSLLSFSTIRTYLDLFNKLTNVLIEEPHCRLDAISSIKDNKNQSLPQLASINKQSLLHELLEKQAFSLPDKVAVVFRNIRITYKELNERANRLARYLLAHGVGISERAIVILDNSPDFLVAILACLKVGLTYTPLSADYPQNYIIEIIQELGASYVLSKNHCFDKVHEAINNVLFVNIDSCKIARESSKNISLQFSNLNHAYIIYTSGSYGKPKGVAVHHKNLLDFLQAAHSIFQYSINDRVGLFHSNTFDFSVWEIWMALKSGATLYIPDKRTINLPDCLMTYLANNKITVLTQTPSSFSKITQTELPYPKNLSLRLILLGGESLNFESLKRWFNQYPENYPAVYNLYGTTETTIASSYALIDESTLRGHQNVVGRPFPGVSIYILTENNEIASTSTKGELYIAGHGISAGYINNKMLNEKAFVTDFLYNTDCYLYRTGDEGYYDKDGNIVLIGRKDNIFKIRGYRVNTDAIIASLNSHPCIEQSKVCVEGKSSDKKLVAYCLLNPEADLPVQRLITASYEGKLDGKRLMSLPNGMTVAGLNKEETNYNYRENFVQKQYLQNGIQVSNGDCIVDIGANIGLFSIYLSQFYTDLKIYAFEPIKEIHDILATNLYIYNPLAKSFNLALGDKEEVREFIFYKNNSLISTQAQYQTFQEENYTKHALSQRDFNSNFVSNRSTNELLDYYTDHERQVCQVKHISKIISEHSINKIDLLKIDTEFCELDILKGISDSHWDKISQIVLEAFDINNRINQIDQLLTEKGYWVYKERHTDDSSIKLFIIYATKIKNENPNNYKEEDTLSYRWTSLQEADKAIMAYLRKKLPKYMLPNLIRFVDQRSENDNKADFTSCTKIGSTTDDSYKDRESNSMHSSIYEKIVSIWQKVLDRKNISFDKNFFDMGGDSFLMIKLLDELKQNISENITLANLFDHPTIDSLSKFLSFQEEKHYNKNERSINGCNIDDTDDAIAVVGMKGEFSNSQNLMEFWKSIENGENLVSSYSKDFLERCYITPDYVNDKGFIGTSGVVPNLARFDPNFFSLTEKEARTIDPQERLLLQNSWHLLEEAGHVPEKYKEEIGIYIGADENNYYKSSENDNEVDKLASNNEYIASRIAYRLNLTGEAVSIKAACSSSLTSVVKACQSLLQNDMGMAIAGGVSLVLPHKFGYIYKKNDIFAEDGLCRPFDADAHGTVPGSGLGLVLLKRYKDALKDRNNIYAIIKGFATNNDGNNKPSFTAPSAEGQSKCIKKAIKRAGISKEDITYIETHGSGTVLGDAIEFAALEKVFSDKEKHKKSCALGSVKSNIGHANYAAGIAGLLKTIYMMQYNKIPPNYYFNKLSSSIEMESSKFYINKQPINWGKANERLFAGVSSFGIGGTNAHVILQNLSNNIEEGLTKDLSFHLIILSAKTQWALDQLIDKLKKWLTANNKTPLRDIAYTLQVGRHEFNYRAAWICQSVDELIMQLSSSTALHHKFDPINQEYNSEAKDLLAIGKNWLDGHCIRWEKLYDHPKPKRIALPLYPFCEKQYWLETYNPQQNDNLKEPVSYKYEFSYENFLNLVKRTIGSDHEINMDKNFEALGLDSVFIIDLYSELERVFGIKTAIDDILNLTPKELFYVIQTDNKNGLLTLLREDSGDEKKPPLILIHPGFLGLSVYKNFLELFEDNRRIYGLNNFLYSRGFNQNLSINKVAKYYADIIQKRLTTKSILLAGWSYGGVLAYETARELMKAGKNIQHLAIFDSYLQLPKRFNSKSDFLTFYFNTASKKKLEPSEAYKQYIWKQAESLQSYTPEKLDVDATLFKADKFINGHSIEHDISFYWSKYIKGNFSIISVQSADHDTILKRPHVSVITTKYHEILKGYT